MKLYEHWFASVDYPVGFTFYTKSGRWLEGGINIEERKDWNNNTILNYSVTTIENPTIQKLWEIYADPAIPTEEDRESFEKFCGESFSDEIWQAFLEYCS